MAGNDEQLNLIEGLLTDFEEFKKKHLTKSEEREAVINQLQEQVSELRATKGHQQFFSTTTAEKSTQQVIKELFADKQQVIAPNFDKARINSLQFTTKTVGSMTAAANLTGSVQASYAPQAAVRGRRKTQFRDLVSIVPSATGSWKFYRQNTPTGEGSFSQQTHAALKSQMDYDLTEITITCEYLAGFVVIAKQMMQDLPFLQSFVTNEMVEDYLRAESLLYFGQLYSAATGTAGTSTVTAEKIIETIANLESNDAEVNAICVTHAVWAKILKTKPNDYSIPGGVVITPNGDISIAGVPVLKVNEAFLGNNRVLMGDFTKTQIIQTEGLQVEFNDSENENWRRNLVTCRTEARTALAILRPECFCYMTAGTT